MSVKTFLLPDLGEGLTEAELVKWLVAVGDTIVIDQPVAEVETAKSMVEVPSPYAGTVHELHGMVGEMVLVDSPLFSVLEEGAMAPAAPEYYNWQTQAWVTADAPNYAPVHQFNGWALYMASTSKKKQIAWNFIRHFISPEISIQAVSDPAGGYQPWRTSHSTNHQFWEDRGWRGVDAAEYANAILDTTNHPNRVIDVRIPGSFSYGDALEAQLKLVATGEKTPQQAMDDCVVKFNEITTDLGRAPLVEAYAAHLQ